MRRSNGENHRIKVEMMKEFYPDDTLSEYELDHFLPLELGGCPDCLGTFGLNHMVQVQAPTKSMRLKIIYIAASVMDQ